MLKKNDRFILDLLTSFIFCPCNKSQNFSDAYGILQNGQHYIMLKANRNLIAHDPGSLNKTYEDSVLIPVPSFENGVIKGSDIAVQKGNYKFLGRIEINGKKVIVDLLIDNYDDKKQGVFSWNGSYNLKLK